MRAAYFNQIVNLVVSLLMVPILLRYLGLGEYILWAIFTTFGGLTLQLENSIQVLSVRAISRQYNAGNIRGVLSAIVGARKLFLLLSLIVLIPFMIIGHLYLKFAAESNVGQQWQLEWLLFALAYSVNYFFGFNNAILLALNKISFFNYIGALTRIINFSVTFSLLALGFSVLGLCVSFALSVVTGSSLVAIKARSALKTLESTEGRSETQQSTQTGPHFYELGRYTVFTFAAFAIYKGGVLLAASVFSKGLVGSYSLTLQAYTILTAFALVPIQVWLSALVRTILTKDTDAIFHELRQTLFFANMMFMAGAIAFVILGDRLLVLIGSSIVLPESKELMLVACAFLVELNILVLANLLVTKQRFGFVRTYVICAFTGIAAAVGGILLSKGLFVSLVLFPMMVQCFFGLPSVVRRVSLEFDMTPFGFLRKLLMTK